MRYALPLCCLLLLAAAAPGDPAGPGLSGIVLDGAVAHPGPVDAAAAARLPMVTRDITQMTGHGSRHTHPTGILLRDLLGLAGVQDGPGKHASLRHAVEITGRDGYAVDLSSGELDPMGGDDAAMLVRSGAVVGLAVPGDRAAMRAVKDVVRITVR